MTVVTLMAQGLVDSSFQFHLTSAKNNGITKEEISEILTHAVFYVGWSKAWVAFRMAKEVWAEEVPADSAKEAYEKMCCFQLESQMTDLRDIIGELKRDFFLL